MNGQAWTIGRNHWARTRNLNGPSYYPQGSKPDRARLAVRKDSLTGKTFRYPGYDRHSMYPSQLTYRTAVL